MAGLILGSDDSVGIGGDLPALLRVAGQSLIEYQVRVARAAGAAHIVVLVDQLPAPLVAAFDRLRADGIDIDIARDARDAADRIHPDEMLLIMASGAVGSQSLITELVAINQSVLLTVAGTPEFDHCERIDAHARWAGLGLCEGKLLRATAAMLGDWTLGPTLLRTAVQNGAQLRSLGPSEQGGVLTSEKAALAFSNGLARTQEASDTSWLMRYGVQPIAHFVTPLLIARHLPLDLIMILPIVLLGSALLLVLTGWFSFGFLVYLMASFPAAIAATMASIGSRDAPPLVWFEASKDLALCLMLLAVGWLSSASGAEWGAIVLAGWAASHLLLRARDPAPWHLTSEMAALVMVVTSIFDHAVIGLAMVVGHGLATQISARFRV